MSTANKLSYLNDTKSLLRTSLNKFGSNILTTDTFRSYDTKLNEIYDKLPKVTQSGVGFTLSDVQNGQVDDFKMNGVDLEQNTTNGINKFYLDNNYSANYGEASIEVNNNNSFILRMNKTSSSKQSPCATIEFNASYLKPNTTYTISKKNSNTGYVLEHVGSIRLYINGSYGSFIDADEYTFTTPGQITNFKILLYLFFNNSTTGNYEITFYDIQLEENSTATDFEPYTGGIPSPNPDYPQDIKVVEGRQVITDKGKNLFDKDNITKLNGTININSNDFEGGGLNYAVCISCKPNTTYTVTKRNDGNTNRFALASSETIPSSTISELTPVLNKIRDNDSSTLTLTTEISANYLIVQYYRSAENILTEQQILDSIQIEEGSSSTNFEPYYEPVSYNIDLHGKNEFDGEYEDGYYNMNGTKSSTQDPYGRRSTNLNKIEPNTNYSISINNNIISETIRLFYYDASRKFISTESISNGTFTSPAECYYVSWHSSSLKQNYPDGIPNMMIEQGQTVTTYEDYYDYKLAKISNTDYKNRIYKNNGNWYYEENVEKVVLDGSEVITIQNIGTNNWYYQLSVNCYKTDQLKQMCSHYNNSGIYNSNTYQGIMMLTEGNFVRIRYGEEDTVANFKMWLSNNNVTLWYPLVNPVTTQITNTTLINQLEAISVHTGTNIITISNSNNIIPEIEITRLKELEKLS